MSDNQKINDAVENAQMAFWAAIAESYPEIKSGDFMPAQQFAFFDACKKAVSHWLEMNSEEEPTVPDLPRHK